MTNLGKLLIVIGVICVMAGLALVFHLKIPFLGRLPGDIHIKKENFDLYFPLTSSIVVSLILSFLVWLFRSK